MEQRKKEVISLFMAACNFVVIGMFFYWLIFHALAPCLFGKTEFDKGALATMMGWSATLFIGYAGYILLDKWKEQENQKIMRDEIMFSSKKTFVMMGQLMSISHIKKGNLESIKFDGLKFLYEEIFSSLNLIYRLTQDMEISEIKNSVEFQFTAFLDIREKYESDTIVYDVYYQETRRIAQSFGALHNLLADKVKIK